MLETIRTSHAAASGVQKFHRGSGGVQQLHIVLHGQLRLLMAVSLDDDAAARYLRRLEIGCGEYLAEHHRLFAETDRPFVLREEIDEFVSEDGRAAWLQHDDGNASVDLRGKVSENALKVAARFIEEAEVVKRAPAADV